MIVLSLSIITLLGAAQVFQGDLPDQGRGLADHSAVRRDRDVFEHLLAAITEARRFHGGDIDRAAQLVDD